MPFWPHCGKQKEEDARFCTNCGISFEPGTTHPSNSFIPPPPPVYASQPIQPPAIINKPSVVANAGFWGSLMVLIGFFTNWVTVPGGEGIGISAFKLVTMSRGTLLGDEGYNSRGNVYNSIILVKILLIIIFITALISFLYCVGQRISNQFGLLCKWIPFIIILGGIIYVLTQIQKEPREYESQQFQFDFIGIGFYLSLVGSIILLFQKMRRT